jgi:tetratricopeptide (TPR) repeat protein
VLYELGIRAAIEQKDYVNAIRYGEKAVALEPGHFRVHYNLGLAYSRSEQSQAAIKHFELALKFVPKDQAFFMREGAQMLNSFAWLLVTCPDEGLRDYPKAVELARQACSLTQSKHPEYLNTLASAYARNGNLREAIKTSEKAVALARAKGNQKTITQLQRQLDLFKEALPESK